MYYFKFQYAGAETKYMRSIRSFIDISNKSWDREYILFVRQDWTTWTEVKTFVPGNCACGRSYLGKNGVPFVGSLHPTTPFLNINELIEELRRAWKCKVCFYQKEILQGNWAPREVYEELGLPIPY